MPSHWNRRSDGGPELLHPPERAFEVEHLIVHVPAEGVGNLRSVGAMSGGRRAVDVVPTFRRRRRRVDVAGISFAHDQRQRREEAPLLVGEGLARPFDRSAGRVVEIAASPFDGLVVISLENDRPLGGVAGDNFDDTTRVCAITHEIAEKSKALRAAAPSVTETRVQGFQIAVDVGQQGG